MLVEPDDEVDEDVVDLVYIEQVPEGLGTRPVYRNGARWAPVRLVGTDVAALVQPTGDPPLVFDTWFEYVDLWVALTFIEHGSMTSGTDVFTLGLATPTVVLRCDWPTDDALTVTAWRYQPERRVHDIAALICDLGFEPLVRAATEAVLGDPDISTWDQVAVDGSDTAEISASVAVDHADAAELVRWMRRFGEGEWIDAILHPDSPIGREREQARRADRRPPARRRRRRRGRRRGLVAGLRPGRVGR